MIPQKSPPPLRGKSHKYPPPLREKPTITVPSPLTGEGQGGGEKIDAEVMLPLPLIPSREGRGDKKVFPPGEGQGGAGLVVIPGPTRNLGMHKISC